MDDYTIRRIEECLAHPAFHRAATVQEHVDACALLAGACNPVAIRALLDERDRLREALQELLAVAPSKAPGADVLVGATERHKAAIAAARAALDNTNG